MTPFLNVQSAKSTSWNIVLYRLISQFPKSSLWSANSIKLHSNDVNTFILRSLMRRGLLKAASLVSWGAHGALSGMNSVRSGAGGAPREMNGSWWGSVDNARPKWWNRTLGSSKKIILRGSLNPGCLLLAATAPRRWAEHLARWLKDPWQRKVCWSHARQYGEFTVLPIMCNTNRQRYTPINGFSIYMQNGPLHEELMRGCSIYEHNSRAFFGGCGRLAGNTLGDWHFALFSTHLCLMWISIELSLHRFTAAKKKRNWTMDILLFGSKDNSAKVPLNE